MPRLLYLLRVDPFAPRPQAVQGMATAGALAALGAEVVVVADAPPPKGRKAPSPADALAFHGLPAQPGLSVWWPRMAWPPGGSVLRAAFVRGAARGVDAVLTRDPREAGGLGRTDARAGVPRRPRVVLEWHALSALTGEEDRGEDEAARAADAHVAVSAGLAEALSGRFPGIEVHVVPNGARLDAAAAAARVAALGTARAVVHAGLLRRAQDSGPLAGLLAEIPEGLELRIAGPPDHPAARALLAGAGRAAGRVVFTGFLPPARSASLYDGALCALAPYADTPNTREFASPLKVLEAHAAGVPLVASDLGTVRALADHGVDAVLVDPARPGGWADAVARLDRDRTSAARLASSGLARAATRTWESRARALWPVLFPGHPVPA